MTDTRAYVLAVLAAAAMMMVSGCSGSAASPDAAPAVPGAAQPQTAPRAFDPPADFGPPTIEMSRDPAPGAAPVVEVLDDVHGWRIGSQGLVRVDLTTGVVTPGVFPDNPLDTSVDLDKIDNGGWSQDPAGDPIVADTPAGRLALAAFPITVPGRGTTPGGIAVELVGADVATGQKTLTTLVPLPAGDTPGFHPDITYVGVIGVRAATAVLTVHTNEYALTAAVDLTSRQVAWTAPEQAGHTIIGDTVIVSIGSWPDEVHTGGLAVSDGRNRWRSTATGQVFPIGRHRVLINDSVSSTVLNAATGDPTPIRALQDDQYNWQCFYDQRAVTVCQSGSRPVEILLGLDETGNELWRIVNQTGATRIPPAVSAVWHGAVYGSTRDGGPVILDARTGADRTPTATATPTLVNEYFGITTAPSRHHSGYSTVAVPAIR